MPDLELTNTHPDAPVGREDVQSTFIDEPEYASPSEDEENPSQRSGYEEPPEYDATSATAHLTNYAEQAAADTAREKVERINQELARLPNRMPPEEAFLRMSEREKTMFSQAMARRQQLLNMRDNIVPMEYQQTRSSNRQLAQTIVQQQQSLQSRYPDHWPKVLDEVRTLVDSGQIGAEHLANPAMYEVVHKLVLGQEAEEKAGRNKLRKMAAGASLASQGGSGAQKNFVASDVPPRHMEQRLRKMGLSEDQIRRTMQRNFGA